MLVGDFVLWVGGRVLYSFFHVKVSPEIASPAEPGLCCLTTLTSVLTCTKANTHVSRRSQVVTQRPPHPVARNRNRAASSKLSLNRSQSQAPFVFQSTLSLCARLTK